MLYSAFTYFTGFKVNSAEYKVMGLAPYGEPKYVQAIFDHLIDLKEDGSFRMNMEYFDYCAGLRMTNERFADLFGGPPREPESKLTQREMDLARSLQEVTEEIMLRMARHVHKETGEKNLVLAGGVALNCVGNGRVLREGPFRGYLDSAGRRRRGRCARGRAVRLARVSGQAPHGLRRREGLAARVLSRARLQRRRDRALSADERDRLPEASRRRSCRTQVADLDRPGKRDRMVPGADGVRPAGTGVAGASSAMPGRPKMQSIMNLKIKFRESFRPFAPSVLEEHVSEYFQIDRASPYMLLVAPVVDETAASR